MSFHRRYALRGFFGGSGDSGGEVLPSAEEGAFGLSTEGNETGITSLGSETQNSMHKWYTLGWRFTAVEAFSIVGFRQKHNNSYNKFMRLWDVDGNLVASITTDDVATDWISYYLDNPVTVAAGEIYTVSVYTGDYTYASKSTTTFNAKLRDIQPCVSGYDKNEFPTGTTFDVYNIDIIIAPIVAELPDTYQVERTTMDDIAEEVQRITGATGKMNTAQIITALENIAVQTTE